MKKIKKLLATMLVAVLATSGIPGVANAEADYVWLEAEEGTISEYNVLNMNTTSGGKGVLLENQTGTAGQVEFEFTIAEAGEYDIKILTSAGNMLHLSKYKWSLDGSTPAYNNNAAITDQVYTAGMLMTSQAVKWYPITTTNLTAGTHTIVISCDEKRSYNDWISHFFDCVAVVPSSWAWTPDGLTQPEAPTEVAVTGVNIEETELELDVGDSHELTYEVLPANANNKDVTWSSSNVNVALVTDGRVTAMRAGEAVITVTTADGAFTDTCNVTVSASEAEEAGYIWLEAESGIVGGTGFVEANNASASGGKGMQVFKSDTNPTSLTFIFDIEEAGEYDLKILSWEVKYHTTAYKWKLDGGEATSASASTNAESYRHYIGGGTLPVQWHDTATVSLAEGTHTLTITADTKRGYSDYIMTYIDAIGIAPAEWGWIASGIAKPQQPAAVEEVDIVESSLEMLGGETYELTYEIYPENAVARNIVWTSSNNNVATVSDGVVTAISGGEATITLTIDGEITDTLEVEVSAAKVNSTWINIADVTNVNQPGVSTGGGMVSVSTAQPEGTIYEFEIPFRVPEEGTYDVYFVGGPHGVTHASYYSKYLVDGEGDGTITDSKYYSQKGTAGQAPSTLPMNWMKLDELTLDTEEHTITFVFDQPRSLGGQFMFALKYLVLVPKGTELKLDGTAAENAAEVLLSGIFIEETTAAEDLLLHMNAINGAEVTWTSSDDDIIDEYGNVTRPGYYEEDAVVTLTANISVTEYGSTITATKDFEITVPKKGAYTIEDFSITSGNSGLEASVNIANNTDEEKSAVLVFALYDDKGAMVSVASKMVELSENLQTVEAEIAVESLGEGYTAEAFLWTDFENKQLIEDSILTYAN